MRGFTDVVGDLRRGAVTAELNDALAEVVEAVRESGKQGEVVLKLCFKPNGNGAVFVTDSIRKKIPEPVKADSFFFITADGSLVRNDPRQEEMKFPRGVDGAIEGEATVVNKGA